MTPRQPLHTRRIQRCSSLSRYTELPKTSLESPFADTDVSAPPSGHDETTVVHKAFPTVINAERFQLRRHAIDTVNKQRTPQYGYVRVRHDDMALHSPQNHALTPNRRLSGILA